MKTFNLRQKYNGLLQKFIRLFSLSGVAFVLTACYGCPYAEYDVRGCIYDDENTLEDIQVIVRTFDSYYMGRIDTVYTDENGRYHTTIGLTSSGGDCIEVVAHDPKGVYASDSVHISSGKMTIEDKDSWNVRYSMRADLQLKKK